MKEALRQLKELQTERREREKTEMDDAIRLLKTQQMKGLPYEPEATVNGIGVLYTSARRDLLKDSLLAEKAGFNLTQYAAFVACTAGDLVTGAFSPSPHLVTL
jgi:hypothetical protein